MLLRVLVGASIAAVLGLSTSPAQALSDNQQQLIVAELLRRIVAAETAALIQPQTIPYIDSDGAYPASEIALSQQIERLGRLLRAQ